jgi:hypothetical protein
MSLQIEQAGLIDMKSFYGLFTLYFTGACNQRAAPAKSSLRLQ